VGDGGVYTSGTPAEVWKYERGGRESPLPQRMEPHRADQRFPSRTSVLGFMRGTKAPGRTLSMLHST
jgi:hypothetical protein